MRVLRISHSAVVTAWRERERELLRQGVSARLVSARVWNEGGTDVAFCPHGDWFAEGARTLGRHPNVFLFDPRPLWRALRAGHWDVLDIHEEPCSLAVAEVLALRRLARSHAPVVLYSAQNIAKRYPPPFRWFERVALRTAAGISVCNHEAGEILRRKGAGGVVAEIPLGLDLADFAPTERDAPRAPPRVGYVGRLEHRKGVAIAIAAVAQQPGVRLDIVGAGPDEASFRADVERLGIGARVRFRGAVPAGELPAVYRDLDALVMPSLPTPGWLEQFGRVAVEAMACGVPVIASRSGALPDVVGDAGVLVEPGDAAALAAALKLVGDDPQLWHRLRAAGLARVARFTWSAVAEDMRDLYEQVTGPGPRPAADPPPTARSLEVVVVAYGTPDKLAAALAPLAGAVPITIVDNSSSSQTAELATRYGARYLDPGSNLGFGAAVNYALRDLAHPDADVLLLNPDARIEPGEVRRLHAHLAADDRIAAAGPAQIDNTGAQSVVYWPFPSPRQAVLEAVGLSRFGRPGEFVIGSILLLRREAIAEVGEFDERFFLYAEETDWQRRARDDGWAIRYVSSVHGQHEGAGAEVDPGWRETQFTASLELYLRKHHGAAGWQVFRVAGLAGALVRSLVLFGPARAAARRRVRLFLRGPARLLAAARRPGSPGPGSAEQDG